MPLRQPRRHSGGAAAGAARVVIEPRAHRYESVVFASTSVSLSLALEGVVRARCRDKLLLAPERRYAGLAGMKPSALVSRCAAHSHNLRFQNLSSSFWVAVILGCTCSAARRGCVLLCAILYG